MCRYRLRWAVGVAFALLLSGCLAGLGLFEDEGVAFTY